MHTTFIFNGGSGTGHPIKQTLTPRASNVIHEIQCQHCKLLYIGETGRTLKIRIYLHLNHIRNASIETTLYAHFTSQGIESNPLWSSNQCKCLEHIMIQKLSTKTPNGLNEKP